MPILPFVFLALAMAASIVWRGQRRVAGRALVVLVLMAMVVSASAYRFSERHAKDDYRAATEAARKIIAANGVVWWAADVAGANYYALSLHPRSERAFSASNMTLAELEEFPVPNLVVLSKRDIYDNKGELQQWLLKNGFTIFCQLKAFDLYKQLLKQGQFAEGLRFAALQKADPNQER